MTTTTIWRAKCEHHDRRVLDRDDVPSWSACMCCSVKWQRWEVSERHGWACGDSGIISESDAHDRASMFGMPAKRTVRRTLRRVQ